MSDAMDQDLAMFNRALEKTLVAECDRLRAENDRMREAIIYARDTAAVDELDGWVEFFNKALGDEQTSQSDDR